MSKYLGERTRTTIRLPKELYSTLQELAKSSKLSLNDLITNILKENTN